MTHVLIVSGRVQNLELDREFLPTASFELVAPVPGEYGDEAHPVYTARAHLVDKLSHLPAGGRIQLVGHLRTQDGETIIEPTEITFVDPPYVYELFLDAGSAAALRGKA